MLNAHVEHYVSILCKDNHLSRKRYKTIDEIADKYSCWGKGTPRMGLQKNLNAHKGIVAYTFLEIENVLKFTKEILGLGYIKEVIMGQVEK